VEQFKLDRPAPQSIAFAAWVTHDAAQAALARANLNLDSLTRAAARREFRPVATGINVAVDVTSALRHVRSENVVARIPGVEPALTREAVLFTAHWDHKGIGPVANGDSIYNGAEDNASGVAAMLGAAEALARVQPRPPRTPLLIATPGEPRGLPGTEAYTPARRLGRTRGHPLQPRALPPAGRRVPPDVHLCGYGAGGARRHAGRARGGERAGDAALASEFGISAASGTRASLSAGYCS